MSEAGAPKTAGALLRAARERQGVHIAALAASIKVTPRKLEALESDRYGELPDATFTRALAQTVCRVLKIDPQPVLALLPQTPTTGLEHVAGSLNQPFRQRSVRDGGVGLALAAVRPMVWAGGALLVAAAVVSLAPSGLWQQQASGDMAPAASVAPVAAVAAPEAASAAATVAVAPPAAAAPLPSLQPAAAQSATDAAPAPASASVAAGGLPLRISAEQASWVQVRDGRGQLLLSRTVNAGENIELDGVMPMRLTIGNAPGTRVAFRGKAVDLTFWTRETVARLELE